MDSDGNILRALVADEQRTKWVPVDDDQKKALKVKLPRCGGDKFQGLVLDMEDKVRRLPLENGKEKVEWRRVVYTSAAILLSLCCPRFA